MESSLPHSSGMAPPSSESGGRPPRPSPLDDGAAAIAPPILETEVMPTVPEVSMPPSASATTDGADATPSEPPTTQPMSEAVSSPGKFAAAPVSAAADLPGFVAPSPSIVHPESVFGASSSTPSASRAPTMPPPIDGPATAAAVMTKAPSIFPALSKSHPVVVMTADASPAAAGSTPSGAISVTSSDPTSTIAYGHVATKDPMTDMDVEKRHKTGLPVVNSESDQGIAKAVSTMQDVEMSEAKLMNVEESKLKELIANADGNIASVQHHEELPTKVMEMAEAPVNVTEKQLQESASTSTKLPSANSAPDAAMMIDPSFEVIPLGGISDAGNSDNGSAKMNDLPSTTEPKTLMSKANTAVDIGGGTSGAHKPPPVAPGTAATAWATSSYAKAMLSNNNINSSAASIGPALSAPAATSASTQNAPPQGNISATATANNNNVLHPTGRELKVEDALLYLDQVKLEFGDRPRIYNEFLEIMKNFKAQEVDTIGVINRVRSLFHGYNNLILGFNTFLPEGYKIEMRDLEPVFVGPGLTGTSHTPGYTGPGASGGAGRGIPPGRGGPPHPGGRGMGHPQPFGRGGHSGGGRGMPHPGVRGMPGRGPPPSGLGGRGMPGRGGGPTQLGPGRGMVPPGGGRGVGPMAGGRGGMLPLSQGPGGGGMQPMPLQQQAMMHAQNVQQKQAQMASQQQQQQVLQQEQTQHGQTIGEWRESNQQNATRTIEFDHAIMYVTNIKKRFANQPRIYHTFLEILHTYQKEQRGIKEVLEQVSSLFADHPDLLREFTFFLPDAVQEQAKERLSRAAAEAEAKQRAAAVEAAAKQQQAQVAQAHQAAALENAKSKSTPTGWRNTGSIVSASIAKGSRMGQPAGAEPMLPSGTQKFIDMTQPDEVGLESPRRTSVIAPGGAIIAAHQSTQQEAFVYNACVERQFFDLVKAALTSFSRDGQAYAEFIKTLDMYAQEILSRNDMLGYVERLLGKRKDLFEEFKRIINAVGSPDAPSHDDSWHSVPLSEIDFSRCRRCSPSYRALPRDYPNPPCSERSDEEVKVLNDIWVSLPMGSEESNNFRHMRKNQYEETLFRCEDMRFEIDMCIDSNAATLQRLTKIYDELRFLSENELLLTKGSMVKKSYVPGAGLGGKIYQYTLDGRVLGVIHKHAIRRIYGDDGIEMLELCFKNPSVALPIVVNRLRQKNEEFCTAREVLNKKWKDIAEQNYYMSLDHRSFTWRTTDKRATSTRAIVSEIKDRAVNNGLESEAAISARMEKAKEEHGIFYEVTMTIPRKMDLTGLPLPSKTLFTPHLSLMYDNSWAQQDAYRIITFAMERSSINPGDKERCHRLWRDFIGPWFGLRLSWMQSPAALFSASLEPVGEDDDATGGSIDTGEKESGNEDKDVGSSGGEEDVTHDHDFNTPVDNNVVKEEVMEPDATSTLRNGSDNGYFSLTNHIPFPPETFVSTSLGEGKIIRYIKEDSAYEVFILAKSDSARTAHLHVDSIYGTIFPVEPSLLTDQLRANDQEEPERSDDQLIIGTQCLYLFFRLHQILIRRLTIAKKLAIDVSNDPALGRHIEKLTFEGDPDEGKKRYEAFLGLVYSLIDAGIASSEVSEGGKYEDRVRHLLGNNAFELTTMDKLIAHLLKHLQNMANDDMLQNMIEIYRRHEFSGNFKPSAFREEAALMSEGENMYAFQICKVPLADQKIAHVEFLGCIAEDDEDENDAAQHNDDNKRGICHAMDESEFSARDAKRPKRDT